MGLASVKDGGSRGGLTACLRKRCAAARCVPEVETSERLYLSQDDTGLLLNDDVQTHTLRAQCGLGL